MAPCSRVVSRHGTGELGALVTVARVTAALELASDFVDDVCAIDPVEANQLGVPGAHDGWGDGFGLAESHFDVAGEIGPLTFLAG